MVDHQRINGTSFVFSAAVPTFLAVSASEGINILRNTPSVLNTLQENVCAIRAVLDGINALTIPSHAASPIIHIHLHTATPSLTIAAAKAQNLAAAASRDASSFTIAGEERPL
jgi:serine palmitoyltransferase